LSLLIYLIVYFLSPQAWGCRKVSHDSITVELVFFAQSCGRILNAGILVSSDRCILILAGAFSCFIGDVHYNEPFSQVAQAYVAIFVCLFFVAGVFGGRRKKLFLLMRIYLTFQAC
jgi:hypothetical protein